MGIETDLNVSPYYDDANNAINDNYHRILFRPSVPVQAREMTQLQDILQNQIERFGDNIFVAGTIIKGCNFNFDSNYYYTKILDLRPVDSQPVNPSQYVGLLAHEPTSNLYAICVNYQDGYQSQDPNLNTLYFKYLNSGINNEQHFASGTQLTFYTNTDINYANSTNQFANGDVKVASVANAVGTGYSMSVSSGVIFQKGHFIQVGNNVSTIVSKYSNSPSNVVVGFNISENIITELQDTNLYDPSIGSVNYSAPGAHRLQLEPTLAAYPIGSAPTTNFFALVEWDGGNITKSFQKTQYSELGNELARRTSEESGDYYVRPFKVHTESGNSTHNYMVSSAGLAYIEGHRVEQLNNIKTAIRKGTDLKTVSNQIINTNFNNSILVQEMVGNFPSNIGAVVSIRDTAGTKISSDTFSPTFSPAGSEIGTAKVLSVEYSSGVVGTPTAQYTVYLTDIRMNVGKNFRDAKGIYYSGSPSGFADIVLTLDPTLNANIAILTEPSKSSLVFKTSKSGLKNLAATGTLPDYIYRTVNNSVTINGATGNSNLIDQIGSAIYPYGVGRLSTAQEPDIIVVPTAFSSGANFANVTLTTTGNVQVTSGQTNVTPSSGNTTAFTAQYQVGDYICIANTARRIVNISNNTLLTVDTAWAASNTGTTHHKTYPVNVPINFANRNSYMTITDSSLQHLQLSLMSAANTSETLSANMTATVYTNVMIPSDADRNLQANTGITVRLNLANNAGGTSGPWCLGIPFAYNLKNVYRSSNTGTFTANTQSGNTYISANTTGFSNGFAISGYGIVAGTTANVVNATAFVLSSAATVSATGGQYTYGYYSNAAADDITQAFNFKDGQKDAIFDQSFLVKDPNYSSIGLSSTDLLTVVFDAFKPINTGKGYISIDSYDSIVNGSGVIGYETIPNFTSSAGVYYELRDSIDFRAFVANTATYTTNYTSSVINPVYTSTLPSSENYIVAPNQTFKYSAQYYVGRIDKLMINSYGAYSIVEGVASETPTAPADRSGSMTLAVVNVPPIPSLASTTLTTNTALKYVVTSNTVNQNRGYTMKEIGKIDNRVSALEYYTSLNLLEQKASSLTIVSDVTGANRFKNGIFVDDFSTTNSLDLQNPEFRASLSSSENALVPRIAPMQISMRYDSGTNVALQGSLVTLQNGAPVSFISQKYGSDTRQCSDSYYSFVGKVSLSPDYSELPELIVVPPTPPAPPYTVGSLQLTITDENYNVLFSGYTDSVNGTGGIFELPRLGVQDAAAMINNLYGTTLSTWKNFLAPRHATPFIMTQTGYFIPPETGSYTFVISHDDGYSFTINGQTFSSSTWDGGSPTTTGAVSLTAGQYYPMSFMIHPNDVGSSCGILAWQVNGNVYNEYQNITNSMFARDTTPKVAGPVTVPAPDYTAYGIDLGPGISYLVSIPGIYDYNVPTITSTDSYSPPAPIVSDPTTVEPTIEDNTDYNSYYYDSGIYISTEEQGYY
jgi:Domain of unknown function (DUF4815)/PA14 domain